MTMYLFKVVLTLMLWCCMLLFCHKFVKDKRPDEPEGIAAKLEVMKVVDFLFGIGFICFLLAGIAWGVSFIWTVL